MYRGPPPNGRFRPIPSEDQQDFKTVRMATLHVGDFKEFIEKNYINDCTEKLTVMVILRRSHSFLYLTIIEYLCPKGLKRIETLHPKRIVFRQA